MSKVMIVDDDRTTVALLETLLELDGFEVLIVREGNNVISRAEAEPPDVMMIDYHLTDTNGVEVLKNIRSHPDLADIPVVIASGMDVEDEVMAAGANIFVVKPFEPAELSDLFQNLIDAKK